MRALGELEVDWGYLPRLSVSQGAVGLRQPAKLLKLGRNKGFFQLLTGWSLVSNLTRIRLSEERQTHRCNARTIASLFGCVQIELSQVFPVN